MLLKLLNLFNLEQIVWFYCTLGDRVGSILIFSKGLVDFKKIANINCEESLIIYRSFEVWYLKLGVRTKGTVAAAVYAISLPKLQYVMRIICDFKPVYDF